MSLREKQSIFLKNAAKLILWAFDNGYELTGGELWRTIDQQYLYFEGYKLMKLGSNLKLAKTNPKSWTMNSKHLNKCAIDLNLFKDGKYLTSREDFKPLAEYWMKLHPQNISGYNWGKDFNHFQMG